MFFWEPDETDRKKLAAVDEIYAITFGEAFEEAESIKQVVNGRCVILMLSENSVGSFLGYLAFIAAGCVVIVLESSVKNSFCQDMLKKYKPQYIWAGEMWKERLGMQSVYSKYDYYLLKTSYRAYALNDETGVILSTSGSTGNVKCVQLGYKRMKIHAYALADTIGFTKNDSEITTMPMAFVYTLTFINIHILKGATIIMSDRNIMERQFWELFHKYQPTCISGLTLHYEMLDLMKFFGTDCTHLKIFTQGGDVFSMEMRKKIKMYCNQYGKRCYVLYGQTETGGTCGALLLDEDRGKNCIGKPICSGEFELSDTDDAGRGELIYNGKCAMLGYVTDAGGLSKESVNKGAVLTGDIALRDADGFYYIVGRKKRIIKLYGRRTNLDDVESYIRTYSGIQECACVKGKEKIWIVLDKKLKREEEEDMKEKTRDFLGISDIMLGVIHVDSLIRNETGKIMYAKLEELINEEAL